MTQSVFQYYYNIIIRSLLVRPSQSGNVSIVQSLGSLGTITASCTIMGYTKHWIHIDPMVWQWFCAKYDDTRNDSQDVTNYSTLIDTTTGINKSNVIDQRTATTTTTTIGTRFVLEFSQVFVRVLFVPSLCEEIIWRCGTILPPHLTTKRPSLFYILVMNSFYTMSHVMYAKVLSRFRPPPPSSSPSSKLLQTKNNISSSNNKNNNADTHTTTLSNQIDSIEATRKVFTDPSFLFHTYILGYLCSYSYIQAGYALYAPVLIHTVAVSIWLTFLGGNEVLGRKIR